MIRFISLWKHECARTELGGRPGVSERVKARRQQGDRNTTRTLRGFGIDRRGRSDTLTRVGTPILAKSGWLRPKRLVVPTEFPVAVRVRAATQSPFHDAERSLRFGSARL